MIRLTHDEMGIDPGYILWYQPRLNQVYEQFHETIKNKYTLETIINFELVISKNMPEKN